MSETSSETKPTDESATPPAAPPPRAFTQGLGQVFQVVGVVLFLVMMSVCCGSALLNKDFATRSDLTKIKWYGYSAQRALSIGLFAGVFFGIALAGVGLGLQAENRRAPRLAVLLTGMATLFWAIHLMVAAEAARSVLFSAITAGLTVLFGVLYLLAWISAKEMHRDPPPVGHETLPADYKIPYSHQHQDPPEVRLAAELEQRRQRLAVQQKELEEFEKKLKRKFEKED